MKRLNASVVLLLAAATVATAAPRKKKSQEPAPELKIGWVSNDIHHRQVSEKLPAMSADTALNAWRGERLGLEAAVVAPGGTGATTLRPRLSGNLDGMARYMRYTITNDFRACGVPPEKPTWLVPDIVDIDTAKTLVAGETNPLWVTVEVALGTPAGAYPMNLELADAKGKTVASIPFTVNVQDRDLPAPADLKFHLNLWQQPYAVSRYYGVKPWSDEHFRLLDPYAEMLARAGQKTISAIMFYEPWGEQSNDKFEPMIETTRHADGTWSYDYTVFDRWVEYMDSKGVGPIIECYTMIPWDMSFRYKDEANGGEYAYLVTKTNTPEYRELWTSFLKAFAKHLNEKGWFDRTVISMDERAMPDMLRAYEIAQEAVPGIKMSMAGNYHPQLVDKLYNYTITSGDPFPMADIEKRRKEGKITAYYTCCSSPAPNLFSNSDPADGAYLPVYCTATGSDGYLHWSFMNWTDDPLGDTRFKLFAPGDTYFVYPDGRTSIRYERMVEGIMLSEKIRILQEEALANNDLKLYKELEDALLPIRTGLTARHQPTAAVVRALHADIDRLSSK